MRLYGDLMSKARVTFFRIQIFSQDLLQIYLWRYWRLLILTLF